MVRKSKKSPDGGSDPRMGAAHPLARPSGPPDVASLCTSIQEDQVDRKFAIQMEAAIVQRISARVVRAIGLDHDADETSRKAAWVRAERIVRRALQGKPQDDGDQEIARALAGNLAISSAALAPISAYRDEIEAKMRTAAELLPGFALTARTAGFKAIGLAVIIGEAGNLSNYATVRKLWRRLGLGMAPGHEAHAYSTWGRMKGALSGEEWTRAGYSPKRLGQIYGVVTVPLGMNKGKNRYGEIYAARRARTAITHPTGTLAESKADPNRWTPGHSHADAQRVMTKALISDLWSEWRGSKSIVSTSEPLAPAELIAAE